MANSSVSGEWEVGFIPLRSSSTSWAAGPRSTPRWANARMISSSGRWSATSLAANSISDCKMSCVMPVANSSTRKRVHTQASNCEAFRGGHPEGPMPKRLHGELQVGDAENSALRLVGETFDLPALCEDDLLDDGQAQTRALLLGGEVRLEYFSAAIGGNARAVVTDFEHGFGGIAFLGDDLDFAIAIGGLDGIEQQIEKRLPEQLLVGLDAELFALDFQADLLLLQVVVQGPDDFIDHRAKRKLGAADFARAGVIDELIQLRGHLVGFINDIARLPLNLRRCIGLFGDHLGQAADDVERIPGFV